MKITCFLTNKKPLSIFLLAMAVAFGNARAAVPRPSARFAAGVSCVICKSALQEGSKQSTLSTSRRGASAGFCHADCLAIERLEAAFGANRRLFRKLFA